MVSTSENDFRSRCLAEATRIADHLVENHVRWGDHVNWVARSVPQTVSSKDSNRKSPHARTLPYSIYNGVLGPATFLTHAGRATGHQPYLDIGRAAVHEAFRIIEGLLEKGLRSTQASEIRGHYTGLTGAIWTGFEVADMTGDNVLKERSQILMGELERFVPKKGLLDLLSGHAGAVASLTSLATVYGDEQARALAEVFGENLRKRAHRHSDGTVSWPGYGEEWVRNLTGWSHGAAGFAYATGMLYEMTGEDAYLDDCRAAIAYERKYYDADACNWPDFRWGRVDDGKYRFCDVWCHGSGGIGISRVLLRGILKDSECQREAEIALDTTARRTVQMSSWAGYSFTYCHGTAGNAETAWLIGDGLGDSRGRTLAEQVAEQGMRRYGIEARKTWSSAFVDWPTGQPGYHELSMFQGLTGVGYFYLRLADERVPTVLIPGVSHRTPSQN